LYWAAGVDSPSSTGKPTNLTEIKKAGIESYKSTREMFQTENVDLIVHITKEITNV